MNCTKTTQISRGAITFQKCFCTKCQIKKNATKAFWEQFDQVYKDFKNEQ